MFNAVHRRLSPIRITLAALFAAIVVLMTALRSFPQQLSPGWQPQGFTTVIPWHGVPPGMASSAAAVAGVAPISSTPARAKAREMFTRYPKAAYMTEIESWRELPDGGIEFTMRRLPSAD